MNPLQRIEALEKRMMALEAATKGWTTPAPVSRWYKLGLLEPVDRLREYKTEGGAQDGAAAFLKQNYGSQAEPITDAEIEAAIAEVWPQEKAK